MHKPRRGTKGMPQPRRGITNILAHFMQESTAQNLSKNTKNAGLFFALKTNKKQPRHLLGRRLCNRTIERFLPILKGSCESNFCIRILLVFS